LKEIGATAAPHVDLLTLKWARASELFLIQRRIRPWSAPDDPAIAPFLGRCDSPQFIWKPAFPSRAGPMEGYTSPSASAPPEVRALETILTITKRANQPTRIRRPYWGYAALECITSHHPAMNALWTRMKHQDAAYLVNLVTNVGQAAVLLLRPITGAVAHVTALVKAMDRSVENEWRAEYEAKIRESLSGSARMAHRIVTSAAKPPLPQPLGCGEHDPHDAQSVCDSVAESWAIKWCEGDPNLRRSAVDTLRALRAALVTDPWPSMAWFINNVDVHQVRRGARAFKAHTSIGADHTTFEFIAALPDPALSMLIHIFLLCIFSGTFPSQCLFAINLRLGKPKGGTGPSLRSRPSFGSSNSSSHRSSGLGIGNTRTQATRPPPGKDVSVRSRSGRPRQRPPLSGVNRSSRCSTTFGRTTTRSF